MKTLLAIALALFAGLAYAADDAINVARFQPPIVASAAPANLHWIEPNLRRTSLQPFRAVVPSYNGKGNLIASWTPRDDNPASHPTIIFTHGGHGVGPTDIDNAWWARYELNANVLILDSYWSRGRTENWATYTEFGANMRMLDVIAAARFVKSQGANPATTYLIGGSQGGWTGLRVSTQNELTSEIKSLLNGVVAVYPNCYQYSFFGKRIAGVTDSELAPPLAPYALPLLVMTGTRDDATTTSQCNVDKVLKTAEKWLSFEGATHAWDMANRGAGQRAVDGECEKAANTYLHFAMCRSDKYTMQMRSEIKEFVAKHGGLQTTSAPAAPPAPLPAATNAIEVPVQPVPTDEGDFDRRTRELLESMQKR